MSQHDADAVIGAFRREGEDIVEGIRRNITDKQVALTVLVLIATTLSRCGAVKGRYGWAEGEDAYGWEVNGFTQPWPNGEPAVRLHVQPRDGKGFSMERRLTRAEATAAAAYIRENLYPHANPIRRSASAVDAAERSKKLDGGTE